MKRKRKEELERARNLRRKRRQASKRTPACNSKVAQAVAAAVIAACDTPECTRENAIKMMWRIACANEVLKPKTALSALSLIGDWERWKKPAPENPNGATEKTFLQVWIEKKRGATVVSASNSGAPNAGPGAGPVPS